MSRDSYTLHHLFAEISVWLTGQSLCGCSLYPSEYQHNISFLPGPQNFHCATGLIEYQN